MAAFTDTEKDMLQILSVDNTRMDASGVYFCDEQDTGEQETAEPLPDPDPERFKVHQRRALQTQINLDDSDNDPKPRGFSFAVERFKSEDSKNSSPFLYPKLKHSPLEASAAVVKARSSVVIASRLLMRAQKARSTVIVRRQESIQEEERLAKEAAEKASEDSIDAANSKKVAVVGWLRSLGKVLAVNRLERSMSSMMSEVMNDDLLDSQHPSANASCDSDDEIDEDDEDDLDSEEERRRESQRLKSGNRRGSRTAGGRASVLRTSPNSKSPEARRGSVMDRKVSVSHMMGGLQQHSVESDFRFTTGDRNSFANGGTLSSSLADPYSKFISSMCQEYADAHPYHYQPERSQSARGKVSSSSAGKHKVPVVRVSSSQAWKYHFDPQFVGTEPPPLQTVRTARARHTYRPPRPTTGGPNKSKSACLPHKSSTNGANVPIRPKTALVCVKLASIDNDATKEVESIENTSGSGAGPACDAPANVPAAEARAPALSRRAEKEAEDEFALAIPMDTGAGGDDELHAPVSVSEKSPSKKGLKEVSAHASERGSKSAKSPSGNGTNAVRHRKKVSTSAPASRSGYQSTYINGQYAMREMYSPSSSFVVGFGDQRKYILPQDEIKLLPRYMRDTGKIRPRAVVDIRTSFQRERNFFVEER
jgi:hypothetical protein